MFGLLNLDKPQDVTSRKVVDHVQRLVKPAKAGHAGTLDPLATGVLVVCVGPATRLISFVQQQRKVYRGKFLFGRTSDTDDITGNVREVGDARKVPRPEIDDALPRFQGEIEQVPPQFSAVHVKGKRAYERARAGETVPIAPKRVKIHRLELLSYDWPEMELEIECGSGTYIRSLGRDLGELLGCGGVMTELVRTRIGPFDLSDALPMEKLDADRLTDALISPAKAVEHLPRYQATAEECRRLKQGQRIRLDEAPSQTPGQRIAVVTDENQLAALGEFNPRTRQLLPRQVFLR